MSTAEYQRAYYATNDSAYLKNCLFKMIARCMDPQDKKYSNYGGKGIYVCLEWFESPAAFVNWALNNGWKRGLEIDRIDSNGPYSPSNCRWITHVENIRNSSTCKLNMEKAVKIRRLISEGYSTASLASMYGVDRSIINKINKFKLWA